MLHQLFHLNLVRDEQRCLDLAASCNSQTDQPSSGSKLKTVKPVSDMIV